MIRDKRVRLTSLYVPAMPTMIFSISQHIQYQGCSFIASGNKATLTFPNFIVPVDNDQEFTIPVTPANVTKAIAFDETATEPIATDTNTTTFTTADTAYQDLVPDIAQWQQHKVHFQKIHPKATLPLHAIPGSVGVDMASSQNITIKPNSTAIVKTGLKSSFPPDIYLRLASRSSIAIKNVHVGAGVIDSDYRGEIGVVLQNASSEPFKVKIGDRIAQGIFEKLSRPKIILTTDQLSHTTRGQGGFGSTGSSRIATHEINESLFQIDRTRGRRNVRVRRVPRQPIAQLQTNNTIPVQNKELVPHHHPDTTLETRLIHTFKINMNFNSSNS